MSDYQILIDGKPVDHSLYTPIHPRRWYVPLSPQTAVLFGLLRKWWYIRHEGVAVQLDESPQAGRRITAMYTVTFD